MIFVLQISNFRSRNEYFACGVQLYWQGDVDHGLSGLDSMFKSFMCMCYLRSLKTSLGRQILCQVLS